MALPVPCGFLVLDKPAGLTSHACVARVRRAHGLRRVGHGGTLDPAVTGVLPIALGQATRLLPYLSGDKVYRGVVRLGISTSTDDLEGEILAERPLPALDASGIERALDAFRGAILQRPPRVSAVHVDGERAHVRSRRGEVVELPPRPVTIQRLELLGWSPQAAEVELSVQCSAGTYIRALARDLGELLGCGAALARLRRTAALGFRLEQAVALEDLPAPLLDPLLALAHLPHLPVPEPQWHDWRCGRPVVALRALAAGSPVAMLGPDGSLAGMALAVAEGLLQPKLVFDAAG